MTRLVPALAVVLALLFAGSAMGHVERPSYWPDPAADTSITPATGGKVPKARSLASALKRKRRRRSTRVVCQPGLDDAAAARRSRARAADGYDDPPVRPRGA